MPSRFEPEAAGGALWAVGGATRKTVPRGLDATHERAGLLLHEGLWAELDLKLKAEPRSPRFVEFCADHCAAMWPVARWIQAEIAR